ncbi:hypothetical protein [Sphingomonas cavernae]|uniref:Uncharacterized protein n=1 Tax=Sphingomonas cavernae TaxID=2320861 RepID=A0A418WKP7_9SPHN|nr:hypothetical protein [Sphingomonas cavernae]RJF90616.1 hypothetical protein D3876_10355 [Sphingomonas cavernae]
MEPAASASISFDLKGGISASADGPADIAVSRRRVTRDDSGRAASIRKVVVSAAVMRSVYRSNHSTPAQLAVAEIMAFIAHGEHSSFRPRGVCSSPAENADGKLLQCIKNYLAPHKKR